MENSLQRVQQELLAEWGKLEGQVTKLDLWMAENAHVVAGAASLETLQLFKQQRKIEQEEVQSKIFEVVDELQRHKERILVQIRKFSEIGMKFKEFKNEAQDILSDESSSPEMKVEVDAEDHQDASISFQDAFVKELPGFSKQENDGDFILPDYDNTACHSNSSSGQDSTSTIVESTETLKPEEGHGKAFRCGRKCGKKFTTKERLERHEATCNINLALKCPICSKTLEKSYMLDYHFRTAHNPHPTARMTRKHIKTGSKSFSSTQYSKIFASSSELSSHSKVAHGDGTFICRICSKASFVSLNLRAQHESGCNETASMHGGPPVYLSTSTSSGN